jgi:uncharacterized protein YjbI with pentapeptide repeats
MKIHKATEQLDVTVSNLSGSKFDDVNLSGAAFDNVNMSGWTLNNVNLSRLRITDANLTDAAISDARMTGMTIDGILVSDLLAAYAALHSPKPDPVR